MNMVKHEPCPRCQGIGRDTRGDNLCRWPDGHAHCFSCQYHDWTYTPTLGYNPGIKPMKEKEVVTSSNNLAFPRDVSYSIDAMALGWLSKYEITKEELIKHRIMWSAQQQWLIFPVYSNHELLTEGNKLLAFQARVFNPKWESRYYNVGPFHDIYHVINEIEGKGDMVVIVEDIISAIKVGRQFTSIPLFGSSLNHTQLKRLYTTCATEKVLVWLDEDKAEKGMQIAKAATQVGLKTGFICTKHDPKEYTDEEIQNIIET